MANVLRKTFLDISNGFSSGKFRGETVYIQHLSHKDQIQLEELEETFKNEALSNSLPLREDRLKELISKGIWTKEKEEEIAVKKII